jgi:hypothetical protein
MSRISTKETARHAGDWQGMNWIRQDKRLAIYLRDDLACTYCGKGVEQGATLSLDHIRPHSKGGSNHESNLVTCCTLCNSSRGNRSLTVFAAAVDSYIGVPVGTVAKKVRNQTSRKLAPYRQQAKAMIEERGSAAKALSK